MARTPRKHPKPNLRLRGNHYEIRWYWQGKLFEVRIGAIKKAEAEIIRDATAIALAGADDFPDVIAHEPAVKRYAALIQGIEASSSDETLINEYAKHLKSQNPDSKWHSVAKSHLIRASKEITSLQNATTRELQLYLDTYAVETSGATSNRARTALSGFYSYLRTMGHHPENHKPLSRVTKKSETPPPDGIVIWEPDEVKKLLEAADNRRGIGRFGLGCGLELCWWALEHRGHSANQTQEAWPSGTKYLCARSGTTGRRVSWHWTQLEKDESRALCHITGRCKTCDRKIVVYSGRSR